MNEPLMHATITVAARCAERDPVPSLAEARGLAHAVALACDLDDRDVETLQRAAESFAAPPEMCDLSSATMSRRRPKVLSLGGGLDSWAMLLNAERRGELPDVVAFVDVGDADDPTAHPGEWDGTYRHITEVVRPWCEERKIEFVEISARTGYLIRPKNQASRSLFQWLWDMDQIPVAGPNRICTRIAKVERFESWLDARYAGREVEVWIGFDAGETSRVEKDPNAGKVRGPSYGRAPAKSSPLREVSLAWRWTRALAWAMSHAGRINRFPLMESGLCRCRCEALARASGYPVPRKSACQGCVYNTKGDWQRLAAERPHVFAKFVQLWPSLDDQALVRMSGVPVTMEAPRSQFWRCESGGVGHLAASDLICDAPETKGRDHTRARTPATATVELRIELAPRVVLSLSPTNNCVTVSPTDVCAIRAASAPLLAELALRRLAADPDSGGDE